MVEWLKYFEMELERPDRTEWYLMRLMSVVEGLFAKGAIDINKYRIKFDRASRPPPPPKPGDLTPNEQSKKLWISRVGGHVRVVNIKRSELYKTKDQ